MMKTIDDAFRRPLIFAGIEQVIAVMFASLILDCGETMCAVVSSSVGFWVGTIIILYRRGFSPTRGDIEYVRAALIALVIAAVLLVWWKTSMI